MFPTHRHAPFSQPGIDQDWELFSVSSMQEVTDESPPSLASRNGWEANSLRMYGAVGRFLEDKRFGPRQPVSAMTDQADSDGGGDVAIANDGDANDHEANAGRFAKTNGSNNASPFAVAIGSVRQ